VNFDFNDEQREIKSTAKEFLAARFKPEKVRELAESDSPYDDALWGQICELGWPGIAIGEEYDGQGLGTIEAVILAEEMGFALAPSPWISDVAAAFFVEAAGSDEQKSQYLPGMASGQERGAVAFTPPEADPQVSGAAGGASVLVLNAGNGAQIVDPASAELDRLDLIDTTRAYYAVKGSGVELPGDVSGAADRSAVVLSAEMVGVAARALDMALAYAKEREQFGRPIGAYQAVSHRLANMLWDVEEARSLVYYAGWAADAEPESLPLAASMAKARASDAATAVTHEAIQTFGGIGFTWEHDIHFFLKRARVSSQLLGTARRHRERVAALAGLG
jgi:alkylation response protein AidB-like acyl-CoA dehydrogenase